jgi:hypothetical protein
MSAFLSMPLTLRSLRQQTQTPLLDGSNQAPARCSAPASTSAFTTNIVPKIGIARSRDGMNPWERHRANPIISPTKDRWDGNACYKPFAIFNGSQWLLW